MDLLTREGDDAYGPFVPGFKLSAAHALAQHAGLPTRLLDFSDNPFKAAFFAIKDVSDEVVAGGNIAVWVATEDEKLRPPLSQFTTWKSPVEVIRIFRSQIEFLHSQDGLFVACNADGNAYFLSHSEWPTFERVMLGWRVQKLVLPGDLALSLSARLANMRINAFTMMPTIQSVARHVREMYRL